MTFFEFYNTEELKGLRVRYEGGFYKITACCRAEALVEIESLCFNAPRKWVRCESAELIEVNENES